MRPCFAEPQQPPPRVNTSIERFGEPLEACPRPVAVPPTGNSTVRVRMGYDSGFIKQQVPMKLHWLSFYMNFVRHRVT